MLSNRDESTPTRQATSAVHDPIPADPIAREVPRAEQDWLDDIVFLSRDEERHR